MSPTADAHPGRGFWRRSWRLVAVLAAYFFAVVAAAQAQPFVYVANGGSNSVSQYDAAGGVLTPLTPPTVSAGRSPVGLAVSPDGRSVYVVDQLDKTLSQYDVGVAGQLTPKTPATVPTGSIPISVAVSPDGRSVYVTNSGDNTVSQYDVGVGGVLTPKTPAAVAAGGAPFGVAVSPDSKSVYVTNAFNVGTVSQYDVGVGGALSPKTPPTVPAGGPSAFGASGVAVSPDGKSVYTGFAIGAGGPDKVFQFDVGPGGMLTPKTPPEVPAGNAPAGVVVSPDGKSVYVANDFGGGVSQYDVGPGGVLTPKTPAAVGAGTGPFALAISPDGKSVYVPASSPQNTGIVSQFDVGAGGVLTPKTPPSVPAGLSPVGIAVTPLPRVHSTSTGVSCSPGTFAPGDATVCTATVTDTSSSGQSTPTGTVSFTNSGEGRFRGSPCTLSGSGGSASCSVFFTAFARGGRIVAASYGGDATHSVSSGFTGVSVAVPGSTEGCVVFGHGRITAANGDKASFRMLVAASPPRGAEFYRDNGPANAFQLVSSTVDALSCSPDATQASVFGTATVNGAGSVQYRINVQLTAWEFGKDTYRIRLSNGHDSGAQQIRHGDLDIHIRESDHHHRDANADHYKAGATPDGG